MAWFWLANGPLLARIPGPGFGGRTPNFWVQLAFREPRLRQSIHITLTSTPFQYAEEGLLAQTNTEAVLAVLSYITPRLISSRFTLGIQPASRQGSCQKLPTMAQPAAQAAKTAFRTFRELHGVVITAGTMDKTVKVRVGGQKWNSFLKKVTLVTSINMSNPGSLSFTLSSSPRRNFS